MIVTKPKKKKKLSRYTVIIFLMSVIFTIISIKLIYIQFIKHEDYKEQANNTSTKFVSEKAARGKILDKNGNILATNTHTYALTYTKTEESDKLFYNTIDTIIAILKENSESIDDTLKLKVHNDNWYIDYSSNSDSGIKSEDIRFKRDRGLNESIEQDLGYSDENEDLTDAEIKKVNDCLYEITPKQVFYYLIQKYNIGNIIDSDEVNNIIEEYDIKIEESKVNRTKLLIEKGKKITNILLDNGYSYDKLREYVVIKDALTMRSYEGYKSVTISGNISKDSANNIFQKLDDLPGIDVSLEPTRYYPYNNLGSSVIGYLSSINENNKEKYELKGYDAATDLIGVSGIEAAFEEQLRGVTGGTTVKVNSSGRVTEELFKLEAYPGNNVNLTIDKNLQYVAETALEETMANIRSQGEYPNANRGAAIAMEANTGRILALASLPGYDPNLFTISGKLTNEQNKNYFNPDLDTFGAKYISYNGLNKKIDDLFPLDKNGNREDIYDLYPRSFYNYATQGLIPPGSTFKTMTSVAGLESGVIEPDTVIYDGGKFDAHAELFSSENAPECLIYSNYGGSHGNVNVSGALEVSCNYFFYEVAYRMYQQADNKVDGLNALASYAWRFGLGIDPNSQEKASTGIEISENFGQVYNFESYKNTLIALTKFNLRDGLESGSLRGYNFIPFDYSASEEDSEKVKNAKISLKEKITNRLQKVDPNNLKTLSDSDSFAKTLIDDIKTIINNSDKYKENLENYKKNNNNVKIDLDSETMKIANSISLYIVYDVSTEMTSAAQEIYAAIGQGMNTFTPLQLAQYISTVVNGGTRYKAHLVDSITDVDGNVIQDFKPEVLDKIELKESTINAVKEGMSKANQDDYGTAFLTFNGFPIETGGKTGTADFREDQKDIGRAPYATYISFAPLDNPEIVVVSVVYDGGHGGSVAPVAKAIYEQYFKDEILSINPSYAFSNAVNTIPEDNK